MKEHIFCGKWITDREFSDLLPRNVFHRQLDKVNIDCSEHRNRHILFRGEFVLNVLPEKAELYFTADDYAKVYINGEFVSQGPACAYPDKYGYVSVDVRSFLREGRNLIAAHTLYQGLINRVWVSADQRHGFLCDLECDGQVIFSTRPSDWKTSPHTGYRETGTVGYQTQFLETYDSRAAEVGFEQPDFDDSFWQPACVRLHADYTLEPQMTKMLTFEMIRPSVMENRNGTLYIDFGSCYVGYLRMKAVGCPGDEVIVRCAQEENEDGSIRFNLRANCRYEETWILSGRRDTLDWFDYKAFRYAEVILPENCQVEDVCLIARHYPFSLQARLREGWEDLQDVWKLCVHSQRYGVQEVIQDCMEREKGFYVGDGCYTALAHMMLTGDDSIVRKLICDGLHSRFIADGMVTCLGCSMMQEIAEYPLMMLSLMLWHFRVKGDMDFLRTHLPDAQAMLDSYRRDYEKDGLLQDLDKWCVVEWPANFRDGYDVDITEGQVCHEPHIAINAYYIEAVHTVNLLCEYAGMEPYRDELTLKQAFIRAFYDEERHIFCDSRSSRHVSYIGNIFPFAFRLCPDAACEENILQMIETRGITDVSMFGSFPLLVGLVRRGRMDMVKAMLADEGAWRRILREGGTTTFEGWGKDTKWNTSLFHLTLSDGAVFLMDADLKRLFA